ncbi:hypothetical protein WMF45_48750 [Sorangium sp. So ce448]|uniref:hypothetical protein n=1 Tax=Sorangium sp. So ce448 TaxID=3133314 RepID=UPI003F6065F7
MTALLQLPMTELWIAAAITPPLVSRLAPRPRGAFVMTFTLPFVVLLMMVFRPTWSGVER